MSSYLSIYIVPKKKSDKEEKRHILISSYSRNTEIYQRFSENINPVFIGMESSKGEIPYTTIGKEGISAIMRDFDSDINSAKSHLIEYEKYALNNPKYIQEIISTKDYISDLQYWRDKTSFIEDMVNDVGFNDAIEEVCCNID